MSKKDFKEKGHDDGQKSDYNRPNDFMMGVFNTTKQNKEIDEYNDGYEKGKKNRK
ncbi:MAG: hypothetical protein K9G46_06230 [Flavobacteriales bacterium]|nr:hypothetical protein [Flavobacteriales bacterium]